MPNNWAEVLNFADLEKANGLPPGYLSAQMQAESAGNPQAISPAGAQGLFQFMPATAKDMGIDPFDPAQAAEGAARYNGQLFRRYDGDMNKAAAAYNWGMGNVDKFGVDKAPKETRGYVSKIVDSLPQVARNMSGAFSVGEAQAAEAAPDFDSMDDAQLDAYLSSAPAAQPAAAPDFDNMDEAALDNYLSATNVGTIIPGDVTQAGTGDEDIRPDLGRDLNPVEGFAAPFFNMLGDSGLGFADEVAGAAGGLASMAMGGTYNEGYDPAANRINAIEKQFEKQYPNLARYSSALGLVGGGKMIAERSGQVAKKYAPKAFESVATWAKANPLKSTALLGIPTSAGQSYLSETGDRRNPAAGIGAVTGFFGGPVGSMVAKPLAKGASRAIAKLGTNREAALARNAAALGVPERIDPTLQAAPVLNVPPMTHSRIGAVTPKVTATTVPVDAPVINTGGPIPPSSGGVFSMTRGQSGQVPDDQIAEIEALTGIRGTDAQRLANEAASQQNQERIGFINNMAPQDIGKTDINQSVGNVVNQVRSSAASAKGNVNAAYNLAREGGNVKITIPHVQDEIVSGIQRAADDAGVYLPDTSNYPKANGAITQLNKIIEDHTETGDIPLGQLEQWRKRVTGDLKTAQGSEKHFLGLLKSNYDDSMLKIAGNMADAGDSKAILNFKKAVSMRKQYGDLYESNDLVKSIVQGRNGQAMGVDDVRKMLMGSGAISGKSSMATNLKALVRATHEEGNLVKGDLQNAFMKNIFDRISNGFEAGNPEQVMTSSAKMATELGRLFNDQSEFAVELYGQKAVDRAQLAIKELKQISQKQAFVSNPSNSGIWLQRAQKAMDGALSKIPVVGVIHGLAKTGKQAIEQEKISRQAIESLTNSIPTQPKSRYLTLSPAGAITGGAVSSTGTPKQRNQ